MDMYDFKSLSYWLYYLKHLKLFSNPSFNIPYVAFIEFSEVMNYECIYDKIMKTETAFSCYILTHLHWWALGRTGLSCVPWWSKMIKQSNVHTYRHRQSDRILRPFCLRSPTKLWLANRSGRTFLSLPLLGSWENMKLTAQIWAFLKPSHWLSVIHTQLCKKCNVCLILSA